MTDTIEAVARCRNCAGCGWVCENHRDTPWSGLVQQETECCGGAGSPCGACNLEMASAGYVDRAITAHTKALIEGAGEVERELIISTAQRTLGGEQCFASVPLLSQAASTIAALRAELDRAKLDGVRAGIEASAHKATSFLVGDPANDVPLRNPMAHEIADTIRALDPEAIAKGEG